MFAYVPDSEMICHTCGNPSRFSCSKCNIYFCCEGGQCQKQMTPRNYADQKFLYTFLVVMGSKKVKRPCPHHYQQVQPILNTSTGNTSLRSDPPSETLVSN